ncbi:MAG: helix-turn-helix domain-containing protein [Bacteroidota bacterium]
MMLYEFRFPDEPAFFGLSNNIHDQALDDLNANKVDKIIWNRSSESYEIKIGPISSILAPQEIISINFYHTIHLPQAAKGLHGLFFNPEFYCLTFQNQNPDISCNSLLFLGASEIPIITLDETHQRKLSLLWEVFLDELGTRDDIQGEMLQMLLKRFLIILRRLLREKASFQQVNDHQLDTIRQFNYLVNIHFREKHKVKDYADLLHKSPKTLSNLFAQYQQRPPQLIIQQRVVLEAKRLLRFSDQPLQNIAFDLGFEDPAHFSRYFKKMAGLSPRAYKEQFSRLSF